MYPAYGLPYGGGLNLGSNLKGVLPKQGGSSFKERRSPVGRLQVDFAAGKPLILGISLKMRTSGALQTPNLPNRRTGDRRSLFGQHALNI